MTRMLNNQVSQMIVKEGKERSKKVNYFKDLGLKKNKRLKLKVRWPNSLTGNKPHNLLLTHLYIQKPILKPLNL